jgi:capsular exopolysaccharide synthesis family protein
MSRNFELSKQASQSEPFDITPIPWRMADGLPAQHQPAQQPPVAPAEGVDFSRGIATLRKHWKLSVLFAMTVTVTVTIVMFLMHSVYEPEARVEVDPPGGEVFSLDSQHTSSSPADYLETQSKNLQSAQLALEVVRQLHLDQVPEFAGKGTPGEQTVTSTTDNGVLRMTPAEARAVRGLTARRVVLRDTSSRLITVTVGSRNPELAAQITNTLVNSFIKRDFMLREQAIAQSSEWLNRQLDDIKQHREESTQALAAFQKQSGIAGLSETQNTFSEEMMELSKQLMQAQADRIQLQAYLDKFNGQTNASLPQISANPVVQNLTQKLAEVRSELQQTLAVYGKNHPNAIKLQNQADELDAQLKAERASIFSDVRTSYRAAQAREQLMDSRMKGASKDATLLAQYNALKKEADASGALYNTLFQKIKEAGIAASSKSSNIRVVDSAPVLDHPTRPNRLMNIAFGLMAGMIGGILLAFLRDSLDTCIHTPQDLKNALGTNSISIVPIMGNGMVVKGLLPSWRAPAETSQLFMRDRPNSPEAEAVRGLYTAVRLSRYGKAQALLVASPLPGEGKTTISVNLAIALAQQGRTCIVDSDLRKEGVAQVLRIAATYGLSDVLSGKMSLHEVLINSSGVPNLTVLATGRPPEDHGSLIASDAMLDVLNQLRKEFEFVVVDSPPIIPFAEGRTLATMVDGVVLVGRAAQTTRDNLVRSMELLQQVRSAPVIEFVLNAANYSTVDYRYYRYGAAS